MRPVLSPSEDVFVYNAKSIPFLQIAYIVSWLLFARPRLSVSQPKHLAHQAGACRLTIVARDTRTTQNFVCSYTAGLRWFRKKPDHVEAPHVLNDPILRCSYHVGYGVDEDVSFLCLESESENEFGFQGL
jgi:hypothetical protein